MEEETTSTIADVVGLRKEKADPTIIEPTKYVGLEHLKSGGGLTGFGNSTGLKSSKSVFKKGDVLYGKLRPYLDKHAVAPFDGISSTDILVFHSQDTCTSKLFDYYLGSRVFINRAHAESKGVNLPRVSAKDILKFPLEFPGKAEQEIIVSKLDRFTTRREKIEGSLGRLPGLLSDFRESVLHKAVTGALIGADGSDWDSETSLECCEKVQSGGTPRNNPWREQGVPFLKVYNIVNQKVDFDYRPQYIERVVHEGKMKKSICYPGDVIMNIVGPPLGKVAMIDEEIGECNHNQAITLFRPKPHLLQKFLYYLLCEGSNVREIDREMRGVVGQKNISLTQCREFVFKIPPFHQQQEIVAKVDALFAVADQLESRMEIIQGKVKDLPQAVLGRAFLGEL